MKVKHLNIYDTTLAHNEKTWLHKTPTADLFIYNQNYNLVVSYCDHDLRSHLSYKVISCYL